MNTKISFSRRLFLGCNYIFLGVLGLLCIFPVINLLSISLSSSSAAVVGKVGLWPVDFTLASYKFVLQHEEFLRAFLISVKRVALGLPISIFFTVSVAYPLSKEKEAFRWRNVFAWFFVFPMLFGGGLIPSYIVVVKTGLLDKIWALVIPGAVNTFYIILMLNFFRALPKELEEAAFIDGSGHWKTLWKIYLPLSKPSLATIALFIIVGHWNEWFGGIIYMQSPQKYPLQTLLHTLVVNTNVQMMKMEDIRKLRVIGNSTVRSAEVFVSMIPILLIYPFLQKYFTAGIVMGSVKG